MTVDRDSLEAIFASHDCTDFKWIAPGDIVVAQWVRMKCRFGCDGYGNACCPPNTPTVTECRRFFDEYDSCVLFHFEKTVEKPELRSRWNNKINRQLLKLEREVFLRGYYKAFLIFPGTCHFCGECSESRAECQHPDQSRPSPESMAVDVFATARGQGYPIEVLTGYDQAMNRYALLLVE